MAPRLQHDESEERLLFGAIVRWNAFATFTSGLAWWLIADDLRVAGTALSSIISMGLALAAHRRWPQRWVASVYVALACGLFFFAALFEGGSRSQPIYGVVLVIQVSTMVLGIRGLWVTLTVGSVCLLTLLALELTGRLPQQTLTTPLRGTLHVATAFLISAGCSAIIFRRLSSLVQQANSNAHVTLKANTQLNLEIARRQETEAALQTAMERAVEGSRAKSSLLANVSHEIRTPMNAVVGLTDLLLSQPHTPTQRELFETIRLSSESLLVLIDDLLDLTKIESGALQYETVAFAPWLTLTDVERLLAPRAESKGLRLVMQPLGELPTLVTGDPFRLRQVLVNLIGNAIKFTPQGEVVVKACWESGVLQIAVADSGIGIAADKLERIFEPFVQADASVTRHYGGTGLGLSIVKRVLEAQQGSVTVESHVGRGSTFTIQLPAPLALAPAASPVLQSSAPELPLRGLKVLLAEDNAVNELVACRLLSHLGITAEVARNGHEAIAACQANRYDVVLMDVQMPELDGLSATKQIKKSQPDLYIIALTANATAEDRTLAIAAGANDFLSKPVRLDGLSRALQDSRRRAADEVVQGRGQLSQPHST